jgi:hypothetical protein
MQGSLSVRMAGVAIAILAFRCAAPTPTKTKPAPRPANSGPSDNGNGSGDLDDGTDPSPTPAPTSSTPASPGDRDGDGVTDAEDCDPVSAAIVGTKLLEDDLATEKGLFTAADGFLQPSWTYDGAAYRQGRLVDEGDVSVFNRDAAIEDVKVDIRVASTEVGTFTPKLRQMFVVLGTTVAAGQLAAIGCGVEVVGGETNEQKTSIVRLAGPATAVTTTVLQRVNRAALQANEEFGISARLQKGTLTCEVAQAATTTAMATGLGPVRGAVGYFTRQTKGLFKKARICKLK